MRLLNLHFEQQRAEGAVGRMSNARSLLQSAAHSFRPQRPRSSLRLSASLCRHASIGSAPRQTIRLVDGKAVLYRGPAATANWPLITAGIGFAGVGLLTSYSLYNHFTWPLTWKDPDNPPKLASEWTRRMVAAAAGVAGSATAFIFFAVNTHAVTKLTLDATARELIVRTSTRGITAALPFFIMRGPFRRMAQMRGFYKSNRNDERIVPLSSVYRIRGSANEAAIKPINLSNRGSVTLHGLDERKCLEFKIGLERGWYRLETAGGAHPPKGHGFTGFTRRLQHKIRGKTDWDGEKPVDIQLGEKEPWFADRRTFDDVLPLIKRR